MPKLLEVIGVLVICAGFDLLWQSRRELRFWTAAYLNMFRAMARLEQPARLVLMREIAKRRQSALQFLLGMGFAFVLGPTLIVVGLTLLFYVHF
jgi:hypothetical protein